jgi:hypothetical protein
VAENVWHKKVKKWGISGNKREARVGKMTHKNKASTPATTRPTRARPFIWPSLLAKAPSAGCGRRGGVHGDDDRLSSIRRASTGIVAAAVDVSVLLTNLGCSDATEWAS